MHKLNSVSLKSICIYGGILRILMLIAVAFFSEDLSSGLLGSTLLNDDLRYLETAEMYSKSANFIIDTPAIPCSFPPPLTPGSGAGMPSAEKASEPFSAG